MRKDRKKVGLTGLAVVYVGLAVAASVARLATAAVAADRVLAGGAVATRALHTLIDVNLASLACNGREGGVTHLTRRDV